VVTALQPNDRIVMASGHCCCCHVAVLLLISLQMDCGTCWRTRRLHSSAPIAQARASASRFVMALADVDLFFLCALCVFVAMDTQINHNFVCFPCRLCLPLPRRNISVIKCEQERLTTRPWWSSMWVRLLNVLSDASSLLLEAFVTSCMVSRGWCARRSATRFTSTRE
jgi:hypothetical protein